LDFGFPILDLTIHNPQKNFGIWISDFGFNNPQSNNPQSTIHNPLKDTFFPENPNWQDKKL